LRELTVPGAIRSSIAFNLRRLVAAAHCRESESFQCPVAVEASDQGSELPLLDTDRTRRRDLDRVPTGKPPPLSEQSPEARGGPIEDLERAIADPTPHELAATFDPDSIVFGSPAANRGTTQ